MKKIPIGISDFKVLIENDYYYYDKTKLIEDLTNEIGKTLLFTRPRRFGKTLNMSMLKYFFDVRDKEENKKLFKDLYVEKSECFKEQGRCPVIFISLKDIKYKTWEENFNATKNIIHNLATEHKYLLEKLDEYDRKNFEGLLLKKDSGNYIDSLKDLTKHLNEYYNKKVILLIDEYDTPVVSAYENGYYEEAISFFRNFYSAALKDNINLEIGVMTGILRVTKEGIFSGLNNIIVHSILDDEYSSYFGLTEEEVEKSLEYYGMKYSMPAVREWYDGYKFGNSEVYNPWSIVNYISNKKLAPYWVNTCDNGLIYNLMDSSPISLLDDLKTLFNKGEIVKKFNDSFHLNLLKKGQEIWQLMTYSGYLKLNEEIEHNRYSLRIPNKEVYSFFESSFIDNFLGGEDLFYEMMLALKQKNIFLFERKLQDILLTNISYHDLGREEKYYHNLLLGMILANSREYKVSSNSESGYGRCDIILEAKNKGKVSYIFEFKIAKTEEELEIKAKEGLEQIEEKKYDTELKAKGIEDIIKLGIAFFGKKVKVISK